VSNGLVLIASYPKSGNTWTRLVLTRLGGRPEQAFSINRLEGHWQGIARRRLFDDYSPVNAGDLTPAEIELFLPDINRRLAAEVPDPAFVKVHDCARRTEQCGWHYPPDSVRVVIYLTRHPYDVAVSTAHHFGTTPDEAVEIMGDDGVARESSGKLQPSMPQWVGSWSANVISWLDGPYPLALMRYEDVHADPVSAFQELAAAAGLAVGVDEVRRVVDATRFELLQQEEEKQGFRERPKTSTRFFRAGRPGAWKGMLDDSLQARLAREHGAVMERLGYSDDGEAVAIPNGKERPIRGPQSPRN